MPAKPEQTPLHKRFYGFLLIAAGIFLQLVFLRTLSEIHWSRHDPRLFLWGFLGFFASILLIPRKEFLYVLVHEFSHALACLLCGGKIHSIFIAGDHGATKMDRSNTFILIFPYIFPFLALSLILFYSLAEWMGSTNKINDPYFVLMGVAVAHHLFYTVSALTKGQSDIREAGHEAGFGWVLIGNALALAGISIVVFQNIEIQTYVDQFHHVWRTFW